MVRFEDPGSDGLRRPHSHLTDVSLQMVREWEARYPKAKRPDASPSTAQHQGCWR